MSTRRPRGAGDLVVVALAVVVDLFIWGGATELRGGRSLPIAVIPILTTAVYSLLLLRWSHPVGVFAVQWAYALIVLVVPGYAPFVGLLVALHAVASRAPRSTSALALAACTVPFGIACYGSALERSNLEVSSLVSFMAQLALYMVLTVAVWGFGQHTYTLEVERRQVERQHAQETARAQLLHEQAEQDAVRAERLRLARELHDIVGHGVTAMLLQAAGARTLAPGDEQVGRSLDLIRDTGVRTMGELHRMLGLLRAEDEWGSAEPFVQPPALSEQLNELVATAQAADVAVSTQVEGSPVALDRSLDTAAYRIVGEALTNTVKHAGPRSTVALRLAWASDRLTIDVRDRAVEGSRGEPALSSGYGLIGLGERVNLLGGRLEAGPVSGGFLVHAELPFGVPATSEPSGRSPLDVVAAGEP